MRGVWALVHVLAVALVAPSPLAFAQEQEEERREPPVQEPEDHTSDDTEVADPDDTESDDTESDDAESDEGDEDATDEGNDDDLFPEDGDLSDLAPDEEDLEIPDVVVRAAPTAEERVETGGAVQRVGEDVLERFNYDDPGAVLAQIPGAYVRQEDGFGLRPNIGLRGVSSDRSTRVTLLEDGVLFAPAPYAAPAGYYFPLMTRMSGVDVYMGAASIPYGPRTVGGAIDLRNREIPRELRGGIDLALGTTWYGRAHAHVGASNEWGGFLVEGVYLHSDGFKHFGEGAPAPTGFDRGELLLRGELHGALTDDIYHRLELRVGLSGEVSNETYLGLTDLDFHGDETESAQPYLRYEASRLDRMAWWRTQVQVRHRLEWGDHFELRTVAYRHDLDRAWNKLNAIGGIPNETGAQARVDLFNVLRRPGGTNAVLHGILRGTSDTSGRNDYLLIGTNARTFGAMGIQTDAIGRAETAPFRHRIRGGLRLHHDSVDRVHTEDAYAMTGSDEMAVGELVRATGESYTTLVNHAEALALSAYLAWGVSFETLTLTPGVRTELVWTSFSQAGVGQTSDFRGAVLPGGSIEWAIIPELTVFGGVMRGFSPVPPGQAANVIPEESVVYEAGARFTHRETRTSGQLTAFVNDYSNFLQECSFAAGCAESVVDAVENAGAAIIAGLDVRVGADLRLDEVTLPLRAAYTFTYTELREAIPTTAPDPRFAGGQPGDRLPYVPEHQISVQAGVETRVFGVNASASFVSEMWEAAGNAGSASPPPLTDPLFLLDASAYVQLFEPIRLYVRGENLTFTEAIVSRRPFGARPNRPFLLQVGVRITM